MHFEYCNVSVRELNDEEAKPYELLLLADPYKKLIDTYLKYSKIFIATTADEIMGAVVLFPLSNDVVEIKNIAVKVEFQGNGIGKLLLDAAVEIGRKENYTLICIGTANSSIGQLYLYQTKGFEITNIIPNYFLDNYPEAIYEKDIQAKHMIMLTRRL